MERSDSCNIRKTLVSHSPDPRLQTSNIAPIIYMPVFSALAFNKARRVPLRHAKISL